MTDKDRTRTPDWAAAWVGAPAEDCADLVARMRRAVFGHALDLPPSPGSLRARDGAIAALGGNFAQALGTGEAPQEGDAVLMRAAARTRALGHHIGLWTASPGTPHVLHHMARLGTCLHPLARLEDRGLVFAGLYRWL